MKQVNRFFAIISLLIGLIFAQETITAAETQWRRTTPAPGQTYKPIITSPPATALAPALIIPDQTSIPTLPEDAIGIITVTNPSGVNVRANASQNASQIGFINPGETYVCVGVAKNGWYEIVYPIGYSGFVSNKLVRFSESGSVQDTCSYVIGHVRVVDEECGGRMTKGPSPHTDYMGYATPGRTYQCVKVTSNGWYAIVREENGFIVYIAPESGVWIDSEPN